MNDRSLASAPATLLCLLRSVGGAAFVAPGLGTKTFGIPADANGSYLVRLFAARNLALAYGAASRGVRARRLVYRLGLICDVLDIGAGVAGHREGKPGKDAAIDTALSTLAAALGVAGLVFDRDGER